MRFAAVVIAFMALALFILLFVVLLIPVIAEQLNVLANINYEELFLRLKIPISAVEQFLIKNILTDQKEGFLLHYIKDSITSFLIKTNFKKIVNYSVAFTGNILLGILAVVFITFILLYDNKSLRTKVASMIPNQYFEIYMIVIYKIERLLSSYLIGLILQMIAIFTIASVGLSILHIKYALTIAFVAALTNVIPYAGPLLGTIFGVIVSISSNRLLVFSPNDYIFLALKVIIVFVIVQLADNLILQPFIFSKSIKAHPLVIFLVIFAGATIAGIGGMIIAVPFYTVLRVTTRELYDAYKQYRILQA